MTDLRFTSSSTDSSLYDHHMTRFDTLYAGKLSSNQPHEVLDIIQSTLPNAVGAVSKHDAELALFHDNIADDKFLDVNRGNSWNLRLPYQESLAYNGPSGFNFAHASGHGQISGDIAANAIALNAIADPNIGYDLVEHQALHGNSFAGAEASIFKEKVSCSFNGCTKTFTRMADRDRHLLHFHYRIGHHCQVLGCSNNKGKGYCRPDKLKAHMREKHGQVANLSYTKIAKSGA